MSSFLVVYGTEAGQTATVADRVASTIADRGHDVTTVDVTDVDESHAPDGFDAVVVGASVHSRAHQDVIRSFVNQHWEALATRPTAFFQLSVSSATDGARPRAEAAQSVEAFLADTDWRPDRIGLFGGALSYSKYGFLKRLLTERLARGAPDDVDASRDGEVVDWEEVAAFARDVAVFAERRLGVGGPDAPEPR